MLPAPISILADSSTTMVLAVWPKPAPIQFVYECTMDTVHIAAANYLVKTELPFDHRKPGNFPQWSWRFASNELVPTREELVTEEMRQRAILTQMRTYTIDFVMRHMDIMRSFVATGVIGQEMVYLAKELQARRLKEANFDPKLLVESPYIVQYADDTGISIEQAVDEILFKARLDHEHLAKTERVRHKLFDETKNAKTVDELNKIILRLRREADE